METTSELYALLIGINYYFPNRLSDGSSYRNLEGAVRDALHTRAFLQTMRQVPDSHILQLTSTLNPETETPIEPPEQLPTYNNIVQKFQALTQMAPAGSQVYIHYSGHGGRTRTHYPQLKGGANGIDEALVPIDIGRPEGQYLRDIELGKLLKDMVAKGLIVTVVLDSCHSGGATRGEAQARGLDTIDTTPRPVSTLVGTPEELAQTWESLNSENTRGANSGWLPESRDYVLLAACRPNELAYEYAFDSETRQRNGALTHWLLDTLRQQNSSLTYKDLHDRVNGKIRTQFPQQTPMLMGEGNRLVFGSDRADIQYSIPVMTVDAIKKTVKLEAGQAAGLRLGAEFAIYSNGTRDFSNFDDRLAIVKIDDLGSTSSQGPLEPILGQRRVEPGDVAILIAASTNLIKKVQLIEQQKFSAELNALQAVKPLLELNPWLTLVEAETPSHYMVAVNRAGEYEICDQAGVAIPLRPAIPVDFPNAARKVIDRLVHLAKYHATESLDNFDKNSPLFGKLQIAWLGKSPNYIPGDPTPETFEAFDDPNNPSLQSGEYAFLKIQNTFTRAVNVAILDLQSSWKIQQAYPEDPGSNFFVVDAGKSEIVPLPLTLPEGYSQVVDVVKVFAAIDSPNFRWLELPALDQPQMTAISRSGDALEALFATIAGSAPGSRDINPVRYPSREWTTQQTRLTVVAPVSRSKSSDGIRSGELTKQPPTIVPSEDLYRNLEKLVQGQNTFGFKLFHAITSTQDNLLISPLNIAIVALIIFNASPEDSPTRLAMYKLLELKGMSATQLNDAAYTLLTHLPTNLEPDLVLTLASSLWLSAVPIASDERIQLLLNYYDAEVQRFGNNLDEAAALMNYWIAQKIFNKTQPEIDPSSLQNIAITLLNTIYFKGTWQFQFDPNVTRPYPVHHFAGTEAIMLMSQTGKFAYYETNELQAIRLPYAKSKLSMDILLPKPEISITEFQSMLTLEDWQILRTILQPRDGTIELPRFQSTSSTNLLPFFKQLSGLDGFELQIAEGNSSHSIDGMTHQICLEINEVGSEIATIEALITTRSLFDNKFKMTVDRPFIYIVQDSDSGMILFMGVMSNP